MIHAMIINHCQSISGKIISENSLQNFVTSLFYHYVRFRICNSSSTSSNSNSSSNSTSSIINNHQYNRSRYPYFWHRRHYRHRHCHSPNHCQK